MGPIFAISTGQLKRSGANRPGIRLLPPLRSAARALRARWTQAVHPFRRARAIRRLRSAPRLSRVLVLCDGNICRSPYAEARLRSLVADRGDLEVASAGLMGTARTTPPEGQEVAHARGLDLSGHRSRLVDPGLVAWADLLVVMTTTQAKIGRKLLQVPSEKILVLGDLDPSPSPHRAILDPLGQPPSFYEHTYSRIDRCVDELVSLVESSS